MTKCFLITMYDEFNTVQKTVNSIKNSFRDSIIFVVQSNDSSGRYLNNIDFFMILDNLAKTIKPYKLASHAITRNYSLLFKTAYETRPNYEFIVGLTGDTLVTDPTNFVRLNEKMIANQKILCCSQAIGQNFHSEDSDPENGRCGGRVQFDGISDFMPQFFLVNGLAASISRMFSNIKITNEYTSEQCLGDEFMLYAQGNFKDSAYIISHNAYDYSDGIIYQVKN
jgi:hypothetical protein